MSRSPYLVNRAFKTFAASTILAVMATSLGVIVNGIIVGNLMGSAELSSVNLVSPIVQLYNALTALVCVGGATLCAVLVGKGCNGDTGKVFAVSMMFTAAFAVILAMIGLLTTGSVTDLLCSDASLKPLVEEYARIALIGSFAYLFLPGLAMFVRVDGSPRTATLALATANIIAPVLCVVFVECGMGLAGASLSVVIGYVIGICILLRHFVKNRSSTMFRPESGGMGLAPKMLVLGAPVALASLMMVAKMLFMNSLTLEWIGTVGMAAMAVSMNVLMIATMLIGGTCQTIQPIGGTLYGSGDVQGISYLTRMVAKVLLISLTVLVLLVIAFPGAFCQVFGITDPSLTDYCSKALRLFAPCALMYGVNYALMVLFQVLGHRRMSIVISVVQPLAVMVLAAVLVRQDTDLLWASFWIGEVAVLAGIAVASFAMRRQDSSLHGFLLGRMPEVPTMAVSVKGDLSDLDGSLDEVCAFLEGQGVPKERCERARLCCEELAMNISQHAVHGDAGRTMDIVARGGEEPSVTVRDDGPMFNPMAFDGEGIGIPIAKRMCSSMAYSRAMGQNNVRFTL